ncbi:hypothetical protein F5X98DRAFT_329076 [Xylaria grammica]|nr:hypothetical protein F5X98DRAFT_329076 [Xylaria grammica]
MTGLAALVVAAAPMNERIHVHYNTANLNLSVRLMNGEKDGDDLTKVYSSKSDSTQGIIVNPSQLGTSLLLGMNMVVGVTKKKDSTTENEISIVSPVYCPLDFTEVDNTAVTVCSGGKDAWVYYLKGADASSIKLYEYTLSDFSATKKADNDEILKGSSLAAYYDTDKEKRYVVYQAKDSNDLWEYCVNDDSTTHLQNSNNAVKATPLGVVYSDEKVYLYYLSSSKKIERIKKESGSWGSSTALDKEADSAYQLSVVWSDAIPHVFYMPKGSTDMAHFRDTKATS